MKKKCNTGGPLPQDPYRGGGSSKSKSKFRFREKSLGGDIIKTGLSFIPGIGQILAPIAGIIDNQLTEQPEPQAPQLKMNNLPYGKFAKGGIINDGFKQYNTGSHKSGNDLPVNSKGDPDINGTSLVQNKENSFEFEDFQYVLSDTLTNPKTGNKFNVDAMKTNKKYPSARFIPDQKNALKLEMSFLKTGNDMLRTKEETKKAKGGYLNGDPEVPASANLAWQAQPIQIPTVPTLSPTSVQSQPLLNPPVPDNYVYDQPKGYDLALDTTVLPGDQPIQLGENLSERNITPTVKSVRKPFTEKLGPLNMNTLGLVAKGIGLAGSVVDALSPTEKEKLIAPDYVKSDKYLQSANIDFTQSKQDAIGASNLLGNVNRSLSSNAASFQGREAARFAQQADQVGQISQQENLAQSQLNMNKGQIENQRAQDLASRKYQNQQNQQMNEANGRLFDRDLMSNLTQLGSSFNRYAETQKMIQNNTELNKFQLNQQLAILNSKYPNFKVTDDVIEKLKKGTSIDEIITMK